MCVGFPSVVKCFIDYGVSQKTCLDPWLLDVSGRCPVCQRQVELPDLQRKGKKERRNNRRTP